MATSLTPDERREVFGDDDPEQYEDEVRERWGDTEAYKQSQARTKRYTKQDWLDIRAESDAIMQRFAELKRAGAAPESTAAMDAAEAHRMQITNRFYDCPKQMHRGLGDMYVADPRFSANYEAVEPGLAQWVRDAIAANAER
jgi:uncharacterized protein (DUF924 family)